MTEVDENKAQYEALGIYGDTWACFAVLDEKDAKTYVWAAAQDGLDVRVAKDADNPKKWHIACRGGLRNSPHAWLLTIRPASEPTPLCRGNNRSQHPQEGRNE